MVISKDSIQNYIPHRAPFIMIDNLLHVSTDHFESDFTIQPTNIFAEDGRFEESGLIENIAQTCAAAFGYLGSKDDNEPAKVGYIGAISKLEIVELPAVASQIHTIITPLHQLGNIYMVKGECFLEGRILLHCEMKIVVTE